MLNHLLATAAAASTLTLAQYSTAQSVGVGEATLRFEAIGSLSYYSNPYLRDDFLDDILPVEDSFAFILDPTAILELGDEESHYELSGNAGLLIRRFDSISALDAEDFHVDLNAAFRSEKSYWNLNAAFAEVSLPEHHTRSSDVTPESDRTNFNWNGSYRYSTRTRIIGGLRYSERSFADSSQFDFSDWDYFSVPLRFVYQMTEKIELGGGVRYRSISQESFDQPSDLAWHLALEGEISTKVTTDLKIGILDQSGSVNTSSADGDLFINLKTRWQATDDSGVVLELDRDSYPTGLNDSVLRQLIKISSDWKVSTKLLAQASISQMKESFDRSSREDTVDRVSIALNYLPSDSQLFSSVSLSYEDNDSNIVGFDYTSTLLNWTTGWRF
ncbi:outer membrane beta-barrel protein [Pelagicoccus sp. SDUM812002]|uniref:outer membrane beta-barrel protein n=1 Tax=Pelagicoccus sp. SDUM812002 TaxID=3041266 RepID=UPI00280E4BA2|nr:outer membrane beta-barrel protein [Pelagicoccus sp. SDUM812002]MDQ8188180.1 outer membrane beta-barrel protein [Pelagicoccus sp. SDUM812002]